MLSIGVLFDFLINLAKVLGGDVGDYSYNAASGVRPHTPNSITGIKTSTNTNTNNQDRTYTYDANGSMTKKYKQEAVTTPPSPLNTLARFMRKSSKTPTPSTSTSSMPMEN